MKFLCNQNCVDSNPLKNYKENRVYEMTEKEAFGLFEKGHLCKFLEYAKKYRFEALDGEAKAFQDDCLMGKFNKIEEKVEDEKEPAKRGRKPREEQKDELKVEEV